MGSQHQQHHCHHPKQRQQTAIDQQERPGQEIRINHQEGRERNRRDEERCGEEVVREQIG